MNKFDKMSLLVFILLSYFLCGCNANEQTFRNLISEFENDTNFYDMNSLLEIEENNSNIPFYEPDIKYEIKDVNSLNSWGINSAKDRILEFSYLSLPRYNKIQNYTESQCRNIAINFLRNKYIGFNNIQWTETVRTYKLATFGVYTFDFNQYINDIETANYISIDIRCDIGVVKGGTFSYGNYINIPQPILSSSDAVNIAINHSDLLNNISYRIPYLLFTRNNKLVWCVYNMIGEKNDWKLYKCDYFIDAINGEILYEECDLLQGVEKEKYININDLKNEYKDIKIILKENNITIILNNQEYKLEINSDMIEKNKAKGKLPAKVKKENDKILFPKDIISYLS